MTTSKRSIQRIQRSLCLVIFLSLNACVGMVVGAAVDTTIEVVKVPFKIVGAVVDLAIPDDDDDDN
ncbi:MAG: NF038104 family lipoprotein [Proteobacteria bacterium]|nr:NF038104 family lipoprotein [Pseudomonadota bacterium]